MSVILRMSSLIIMMYYLWIIETHALLCDTTRSVYFQLSQSQESLIRLSIRCPPQWFYLSKWTNLQIFFLRSLSKWTNLQMFLLRSLSKWTNLQMFFLRSLSKFTNLQMFFLRSFSKWTNLQMFFLLSFFVSFFNISLMTHQCCCGFVFPAFCL